MFARWSFTAGLTVVAALVPGLLAAQPVDQTPTDVEAVVVTAQRAGVPIWRLSNGAGTVVLVGEIDRIPGATPWRPAALEAAVARADAVVLGPSARGSVMDIGRVVMRARRLVFLPEGETVASRYGAELDRRLAALAAADRIGDGYGRKRPFFLAYELLDATDVRGKKAPDVDDVAERAAKRAKVARRPLLQAPVVTLLDDAMTDSPDDVVCLRLAVEAAEQGQAGALSRGRAWTERRVVDVLASPLQQADDICQFGRGGPIGDAVRAAWRNTVEVELTKPGVTVAIAPLATVAGANGILDTLLAQGVTIEGPRWRADQPVGEAFRR